MIYCKKLKREAEALKTLPMPGSLGKKLMNEISKEAWQMWLSHQTMLINEYRLNLTDIKAREFLISEMNKFLFGQGSDKPSGYVPPEKA